MGDVTTYELHTVEQAVQIGTTLTKSWFRGHSSVWGELTPRVFRPEFEDEFVRMMRPDLELSLIDTFKREVPTASGVNLPAEDDQLGWLYLMQHYRTPTRLLDWSQNVLVALFFVVSADFTDDGELWALYPQALNAAAHVGNALPLPEVNPVVKYLVRQPHWAAGDEALAASLGMKTIVPNRPVAFVPTRRFSRLIRQAGAFTIHPRPSPGNTITEVVTEPKHLVRYIVPGRVKPDLVEALYNLGIDHYSLFPEMEGLSKRIEHEAKYMGYGPPAPPPCAGAWKG